MGDRWERCPDEACGGPIVTRDPEIVHDGFGRPTVVQSQYCTWCGRENELAVDQFCPCCKTYLGRD